MRQSAQFQEDSPMDMMKSSRLWNAFDTNDPYPDQKFTTNITSASVPQTLTPHSKTPRLSLYKTKSGSSKGGNKNRRKKDELVKTLLFSNRNR